MRARRKLQMCALAVALTYALIEALSLATFFALEGSWLPFGELQRQRDLRLRAVGAIGPAGETVSGYVIHPYTGYVKTPGSRYKFYPGEMNALGFAGSDDMLEIRPDDYVVVVTGGSLAMRVFIDSADVLAGELATATGVALERIKVVCLAMSAFRQPQSSMAVLYFLALGGRIDLLLNIDGFNEVAMLTPGLHPSYPSIWPSLVSDLNTPERTRAAGQIAFLQGVADLNTRFASYLHFSATANLSWMLGDRILTRRTGRLDRRLQQMSEVTLDGAPFSRTGPALAADADLLEESVEIWARSSEQMHRLAVGSGFDYFHFLQPNQYVSGTKRFTREQARRALGQEAMWKGKVDLGYPKLLGRAPRLDGVVFTDLTNIYRDVDASVYIDNCCHLNKLGADLLVRAIAETVRRSWAPPRTADPSR